MLRLPIRIVLIPILLVGAFTSFHAQSPAGGQTPAAQPAGYPAKGQPAIVRLTSAGTAPRSVLRYAVAANYKTHMDMSIAMGLSVSGPGSPAHQIQMPAMTIGAELSVTNVTPAGDVSYEFAYTSVRLDGSGAVDPEIAPLFQNLDGDVKTVRGAATMTSWGVTRDARIDTSKMTNPLMSETLDSLSNSLAGLTVPLPQEAVGAGARWESRQTIQTRGLAVFQRTLWELIALDGKTMKLKTAIEQTAPPQSLSNERMPAGSERMLQKFTGRGSGTVTIALDALVPTSEVNSQTDMTMTTRTGGQTHQLSLSDTMKLTIAPGK